MNGSPGNGTSGARPASLRPLALAAGVPFLAGVIVPNMLGFVLVATAASVAVAAGTSRSCAMLCATPFAGAFGLGAGYAAGNAFFDGDLAAAMLLPLTTVGLGVLLFPVAMIGGAIGWALTPSPSKEKELPPNVPDSSCPWCGAPTASDNLRCRNCGRWLPEPSPGQQRHPVPGGSAF